MKTSRNGIAYKTDGSETSDYGIVLVHGWGCRHSDYDSVHRNMVADKDLDARIVAVDLPGHGETPARTLPNPSMTGFAQVVLTLCHELDLKKIVLVGHSMGVRVIIEAWRISLANPLSEVQGLVFVDGSHYKLRKSLFAFDKADPRSASLTEEEKAAMKAEAFQSMFSPSTPKDFKDSTLNHIADMDQPYSQAMRDSMITYDREDLDNSLERLGKEGTPLLNLQSCAIGPDNDRVPMREGQRSEFMQHLEGKVPQVKQIVITESAHFPHVDRPIEVARYVSEFVKELRKP